MKIRLSILHSTSTSCKALTLLFALASLGCQPQAKRGSPYLNKIEILSLGLELVSVSGRDSSLGCALIRPVQHSDTGAQLGIGMKLHIRYLSDSSDRTYNRIGYFAPGGDGLIDSIAVFRLGFRTDESDVNWMQNEDFDTPSFDCIDYPSRPTTLLNHERHPYRACCPLSLFKGIDDLRYRVNHGGSFPLTSNYPHDEDLIELFLWPRPGRFPTNGQIPRMQFHIQLASGKVFHFSS